MRKYLIFCVAILFSGFLTAGNDSTKTLSVGLNYGYGFIIPHSPIINFLANRHISQTEVFLEKRTWGKKAWHSRHNFPDLGLLFSNFNLHNDRHIGNVYSLSPYMKFRLAGTQKFNLKLRTSLGIGYIEKPFDTESNFKNAAIGSNINMYISLQLSTNWQLSKRMSWNGGAAFSHLSNAGFKTPNLGYNMLTFYSGVAYHFGENVKSPEKPEKEKPEVYAANWYISCGLGLNEIYPANGKKYFAKALFLKREKQISLNSTLGVGIDIFYNPAQREALRRDSIKISKTENIQLAVSASHLIRFGRLGFTSQLSYYLKSENEKLGKIYHIFGGRWAVNEYYDLFFLGKTHIDKAEYLMIGVGIKLSHEK